MIFLFPNRNFVHNLTQVILFLKFLYTSSHITTVLFLSSIFTRQGIFKTNSQHNLLRAEVTQGMDWDPLGLHKPFEEVREVYTFPTMLSVWIDFPPYTSTRIPYTNSSNVEELMIIQLSLIKPNIKEISQCKTTILLTILYLGK